MEKCLDEAVFRNGTLRDTPRMRIFVPKLGEPVLDLLNQRSGGRILDLGCGDGVLAEK